jgi:uracil-DNA glycosylase
LLLNNTLTVESGIPNSHSQFGWNEFTNNVITTIDQKLNNVVFVLWGNFAKSKLSLLTNKNNYVITAPHPSPLSAHYGFFGSKPFSKINDWLVKCQKTAINW